MQIKPKKNILFVPISPEQLASGMDALFDYINNSEQVPLLKTSIAHAEFESLHPFKDGNGRIGRMLITLMLWNYGLISSPHFYISEYMEEHKDTYINCLRNVSLKNDWMTWCIFFLEAVTIQADRNLAISEKIKNLYEEMKEILTESLNSKWSIQTLDFIFTNPIFRNNKFAKETGIPNQTANKLTTILREEDIIIEIEPASGRRPALYSFERLMELVRV
ncbi:Fic family protein [Pelistega indica]|uniref:Fic family protein n=1 Tax=Pelistega indica TaxID=1414851 RepID=UPI001C441998|nr:Fic family protein [Pelistega indica]